MINLKQYLKLILKFVYVNKLKGLSLEVRSGVGALSKIIFSSESGAYVNQTIHIGKNAGVGRFCELQVWDGQHIDIKDHSTLNDGCKILGDVIIERNCLFSANIFASSGNHYAFANPSWLIKDQDIHVLDTEDGKKKHSRPIQIEEDCWIGYGVFIKQGVSIGRGAIVGANTVISKNIPPYSVQAGSPNKEIKKRLDFLPPFSLSSATDGDLPYFYRGFEQKRRVLEMSRTENVIFARKECIAVLSASDDLNILSFSGRKNKDLKNVEVKILWQGRLEWTINITTDSFSYSLSKEMAVSPTDESAMNLFNSIGKDLHNHTLICFQTKITDRIEFPFGLNTIKIEP